MLQARVWCVLMLLLIQLLEMINGVRILGIFPFQTRSHTIVASEFMKELASRGHEVTMISHYPEKENISNYTDIVVKTTLRDIVNNKGKPHNMFDQHYVGIFTTLIFMWKANQATCDKMLQEKEIQKLIHSKDKHFDLVIIEAFLNECFLGFVHKFKTPFIYFCSFGGTHWIGDWVGNPNPYSYVPDPFLPYTDRMTLWERTVNTLVGTFSRLGRQFYYIPGQDSIMRKHFQEVTDLPSLSETEQSTSLILLNSHFSINYPKPLMPSMVQVGGLHVRPPKKLPKDIQNYLDEAQDGMIYFSMGSNLQSALFPAHMREVFLRTFSELKQRVLWKWEADTLPGQPKNVKLGKWLPQSDILAHPNVRLFMTHGGSLSTQEALDRGVPLVGIPVFGDQIINMEMAQSTGYGVILSFDNITYESVRWALNEVLSNARYRETAKRISNVYRDRPLSPLEQAVFWTEYVIRHKGAPHMRSAALDLTWYQYFLLDIIAVLTMAFITVNILLYLTLRTVLRIICRRKRFNEAKKKHD